MKDWEEGNQQCFIYRSNGKHEPDHWYHLITKDYGDGTAETRDINCHNVNSIEFDGYEKVSLAHAEKEMCFKVSEYVDWCLEIPTRDCHDLCLSGINNIVETLKEWEEEKEEEKIQIEDIKVGAIVPFCFYKKFKVIPVAECRNDEILFIVNGEVVGSLVDIDLDD